MKTRPFDPKDHIDNLEVARAYIVELHHWIEGQQMTTADLTDAELVDFLRRAAGVWFKNSDLLLLEELIRRFAARSRAPGVLPNAETIAALDELDAGGGKTYRGSSRTIIKAMLQDDE